MYILWSCCGQVLTEDFRQEQNDKQTEYARAESLHRQLAQLKRQVKVYHKFTAATIT